MEPQTFRVPAIGCAGCVRTIQNEVSEIAGVALVNADEHTKQVVVQWGTPATWEQIKTTLTEIEYPPVPE